MSPSLKALLRKWRNPAPQVEIECDKNGYKIAHDSSNLKRSRGKLHALFIERTVTRPGITLSEMAVALEKSPEKIASVASALIADGLTFEEGGGYFAPHDLVDRLLDERRDTGSDRRERLQSDRHARDRVAHEKYLQEQQRRHEKRLAEVARECGVDVEPEPEADGHVEELERVGDPQDDSMITNANVPEQFKATLKSTREERGIALFRDRGDEIEHLDGGRYSVPSCSGEAVYVVDLRHQSCTCPDHRRHGVVCKHLYAGSIARAKSSECRLCGDRVRSRDLHDVPDDHPTLGALVGELCFGCGRSHGIF